jgi:hypothetical protein
MQQSPSITATEMSSVKKSDKRKEYLDDDGFVVLSGEQSNIYSSHQSP